MSCDTCPLLQCLLLTQLPFSEDLRPYYFGSLPASDKTTPTADQLEAVDNLITAMDLMEAHEWVGPRLMEGSYPCRPSLIADRTVLNTHTTQKIVHLAVEMCCSYRWLLVPLTRSLHQSPHPHITSGSFSLRQCLKVFLCHSLVVCCALPCPGTRREGGVRPSSPSSCSTLCCSEHSTQSGTAPCTRTSCCPSWTH